MIDFGPLLDALLPLAAALLTALSPLVARWIMTLTRLNKLEADDKVRAYLEVALDRGIQYGLGKTQAWRGKAALTLDIQNEAIATGAQYVLARVPDALNHFKLDEQAVKDLVRARLADHLPRE